MAARTLDKKHFETTSPPEPLGQIQNNFTEMFLIMPSAKKCLNGCAPPNKMAAARTPDKKHFKTTTPELLVQTQNNFTKMFLILPSAKTV